MNNRNWIAVFLGLACLVLFVSVMGASGNWLMGNNNNANNGTTPQQINQTVRDMGNGATTTPDQNVPTKIDASGMTSTIMNNNQNDQNNTSTTSQNNGGGLMSDLTMPR